MLCTLLRWLVLNKVKGSSAGRVCGRLLDREDSSYVVYLTRYGLNNTRAVKSVDASVMQQRKGLWDHLLQDCSLLS